MWEAGVSRWGDGERREVAGGVRVGDVGGECRWVPPWRRGWLVGAERMVV